MRKNRLSDGKAMLTSALQSGRFFDHRSKIKILSILALLLMAATGARADSETFNNFSSNPIGTHFTVTFGSRDGNVGLINSSGSSCTITSRGGEIITSAVLSCDDMSVYNQSLTSPGALNTNHGTISWSGWTATVSNVNSSSVTISFGGSIPTRVKTIVVNYTIPTYDITYDGNGSTGGSTEPQTKTHNVDLTLRSNGFTRDGYTFTGWNTLADGNGTPYAAGATYTVNADLSLYAQWQAIFGVATDATMSDGWTIDPTSATAGETVTATYSGSRHVKSVKYLGVPTLTAAPTAIDGLTYDGTAQALVNAGTATNGTLQYKVNDGEYAADIPTATAAGSYTVYYKVVGNNGFVDLVEASVEVEIDKMEGAVTLSRTSVDFGITTANQTVTVSDNTGAVSAAVTSGSGCSVSVSETTITITRSSNNAFNATITVTIAESTNNNSTTETITVSGSQVHIAGDVESATMGSYKCAKLYTSATSGYYIMVSDQSNSATWSTASGYSVSAGDKTFKCGTRPQWEAIMSACGGTGVGYINSKCSGRVSGWTNMVTNKSYWTSTVRANHQYWQFDNDWNFDDDDEKLCVRLIAAF